MSAWKIGLQMTDIILLPFPEIVVQEKIRFVFLHLFIKLLPRARGANEIKGRFLCVVLALVLRLSPRVPAGLVLLVWHVER